MTETNPCPACKRSGTTSTALTFGDLDVGDYFIIFPCDGDDSGHGGFRGRPRVFLKTHVETDDACVYNSVAVGNRNRSHWHSFVQVIAVTI